MKLIWASMRLWRGLLSGAPDLLGGWNRAMASISSVYGVVVFSILSGEHKMRVEPDGAVRFVNDEDKSARHVAG